MPTELVYISESAIHRVVPFKGSAPSRAVALDDDVVGSFGSALVLILRVASAIRFAVTATVELVIHRLGRNENLGDHA